MKAELKAIGGNIRVEVGNTKDNTFYSFELYDDGTIVGGPLCRTTETTITAVRERLKTLLHPAKMS